MSKILLATVLACLTAFVASAETVIPLINASFEDQNPFDQSLGCNPGPNCYNFNLKSWDDHSAGGTLDPALSPAQPHALYGNNVAWLNGGYIAQSLGPLVNGNQYAISVALAGRDNVADNYRLGVSFNSAGGSDTATFTDFYQIFGVTTSNSTWQIDTLHFSPNQSGTWFFFVAQDSGNQLFVDAATPEPSTFTLIGIGAAAFVFFRRIRQ